MSTVLRDLEIIHRDLKPDNLFSRTTEHGKDIVVGDFGLSVPSRQDIRRLADIRTNQQCGTPTYMSPEQFDADLDFDVRSDIYTMGLILYEMIKGHQARHLKNEEMDDLDKCFDACFPEGKRIPDPMDIEDPHIRDLIGIMTDPAVNNRYSDHDAVIAAIDRILHAS
jgi:serine/threonine protein kinase